MSAIIGLLAGVPVGVLAGFGAYSSMAADCGSDGWCNLGASLGGIAVGVLVAYVAYVIAGIIAVFRWQVPGHRLVLVLAHAGTPLLVAGLLYATALLGL